jgi:hypothetical protein
VAELGVVAVAAVRDDQRRPTAPADQLVDHVEGQTPLLPMPDVAGDTGFAAPLLHVRAGLR